MRFTKPSWVVHQDGTRTENVKRLSIFSVSVHPDGSRIATGGLDTKVRIWSTKPILNEAAEAANKPPKSLCTLTMHAGPVLTVRWAYSGRWLASGSDDQHVMIWDLNPNGGGKVWGTDEVNIEGWKPLKRLSGHNSDVTDLAWAPEDRFLASTGLDSAVMIWCGNTLELLRKLTLHQGFVKGVCWDPVCEFLATQSDDRSVRIWRTTDWSLEATIEKPFKHSPGSTFFRRLSWSPDGAHITASNATNSNGYVFTAAVISRNTWTSDISLVGHENTVEVASYNPHIFLRDPSQPVATTNICSVVALGADDNSVSIWQTKSARPLIVAKEVFERQIMDLSWSADGLTLYAVSSDGTLACFAFDSHELEGIAPPDAHNQYLSKFNFNLPSNSIPPPQEKPKVIKDTQGSFGRGSIPPSGGEQVTILNVRRGAKNRSDSRRRIQPIALGSVPTNLQTTDSQSNSVSAPIPTNGRKTSNRLNGSFSPTFPSPDPRMMRGFDSMDLDNALDFGTDTHVPISTLDGQSGKSRDPSIPVEDEGKLMKLRMQGWNFKRNRGTPVGSEQNGDSSILQGIAGPSRITDSSLGSQLPQPEPTSLLRTRIEGSGETLEARNTEGIEEPYDIALYKNLKEETFIWIDYLPSPTLSICASNKFCAAALANGTIIVWSLSGRRIMPTLHLGNPVAYFEASGYYLMAITTAGQVHTWNIKSSSAVHQPISVHPLLIPSPPTSFKPNGTAPVIMSASLRPNGAPLIHLSSGTAHSYDVDLACWVTVGEDFWWGGSTAWKTRTRSSSTAAAAADGAGNGVISSIEMRIAEQIQTQDGDAAQAPANHPPWWTAAYTLDHLGTRMHAARILGSTPEYRQALLLYAKTLADEGMRRRAEELLKELYGPIYWRPGRIDDGWSPTIVGLTKRDLIKDVLTVFARSKTLGKLAQDYQELLKKSNADE